MAYRKERFRLRFEGLSDEAQNDIKAAVPGGEAFRRGNVLLIEIDQAVETTRLYATLDTLRLGPEQFQITASIVTTSDNGGIDVPQYVLSLIRRTHCGVGFSFVDVGPDEEDDRGNEMAEESDLTGGRLIQ